MLINHCSDAMHCVATICNKDWHQTGKDTAMLFAPQSLKPLRTLRALNLGGRAKTCGNVVQ